MTVLCRACREELKEKKQRERNRKIKRFALIGLATVGGGTLIGNIILQISFFLTIGQHRIAYDVISTCV